MKTEWSLFVSKYFLIPQRLVMGIMGFLALAISYTLRASLSLSITEMVIKHHRNSGEAECHPEISVSNITLSPPKGEYEWSEELQGLILSSFFWGYIFTHIPGGVLATKYGGKSVLLGGIFLATLANLLTPICMDLGGSTALIILRVIIGIGQGAVFPACSVLIAAWTPLSERSAMTTLVYSGAQIGYIAGTSISGLLLSQYRWPSVFYFFSGISILWMILFTLLCYNDPASHPFITEKEKDHLYKELGELKRSKNLPPTPWKDILKSAPVMAMIAAQVGHNWGFFVMTSDLPKYMSDVMRFSIKENGFYSALPYLVMWLVSMGSGFLSDFIIVKRYLSLTNVRKLFTFISTIGPGAFIVWASYAGCDRMLVVILFTIGMGLMGPFYSGFKVNNLDLSPNYAGVLMGLSNGIAAFTGMIGPYIVGVITTNRLMSEWQIVFWITFAIFAVTTLIYLIWATGDVQPWNMPQIPNVIENGTECRTTPRVANSDNTKES